AHGQRTDGAGHAGAWPAHARPDAPARPRGAGQGGHRSEERRVGKECRSRCDWSSDVCSSDLLTVSAQMELAMRAHGQPTRAQMRQRALAALAKVGIPDPERRLDAYPHELSGGMRQRVAIAIAF